jgi:glutathione S-transferase
MGYSHRQAKPKSELRMKFYDCATAPSPRRARIFIAEKDVNVETIEINLGGGEHFGAAFRRINPSCTVPALELDDGTVLTENLGIAAYLEAAFPDPPLLGDTAVMKGIVANWNARIELEGLLPTADAFRNRTKGMKNHAITGPKEYAQIPELAARGLDRCRDFFAMLNERLSDNEFVAGERYSIADISALCVVDFAAWVKVTIDEEETHLQRWHRQVSARPSASV